jgi:hypothetical protein
VPIEKLKKLCVLNSGLVAQLLELARMHDLVNAMFLV